MIIWNCNFNIPDSTIQLAQAYIRVISYKNINSRAIATIQVADETGEVIIKEYQQNFDRNFNNEDEIYEDILIDYQPGYIS